MSYDSTSNSVQYFTSDNGQTYLTRLNCQNFEKQNIFSVDKFQPGGLTYDKEKNSFLIGAQGKVLVFKNDEFISISNLKEKLVDEFISNQPIYAPNTLQIF